MADIAQIGFAADTSALNNAKTAMEALSPAAAKADSSSAKLSASLGKINAAADKLLSAATGLSSAVDKMAGVLERSGGAANTAAVAQGKLAASTTKVTVTYGAVAAAAAGAATATKEAASASTGAASALGAVSVAAEATSINVTQLDAHMTEYRANLRQLKIDAMAAGNSSQQLDAHMHAFRDNLDKAGVAAGKTGKAIKFTAQDSLNAMRQLSDIGVTAAMGMNPLMIAVQQGPQLLDILQNKAAVTGQTLGAVFRAAGVAIMAAIAPLLPIILGLAAGIGLVAGAFGLATHQIREGNENIAKGLDLSTKQMEKLKKAGVDTGVTMGDTFKAFFEVIGERLSKLFAGPLKSLSKTWDTFLDYTAKGGEIWIKNIIGGFVGGFYAIKAAWGMLPAAIGDIVYSTASIALKGIDFLVNKSIDGLNSLIGYANAAAEKVGLSGIGKIDNVSFAQAKNPYAGAASDAGTALAEGFAKGKAASDGAVDRFFADVGKRARKNREKLILEAAGDAEKAAKTPKGPKSDAAKFDDIVKGAENDIAAQNARANAVNLSAEAAATLEEKTKLLNEANSKGIALTDGMRSKIDELAGAFGRAKAAADNAIALRDILKGADGDIAGLQSQAELIGLVGRNLAYQTEMQKLLNDAKAKQLPIDAAAMAQFQAKANTFADQSQSNANDEFTASYTRDAAERMRALQEEATYIGLNAQEVTRLRIENELLASARQKNIDLSPADIAAIQGIASEQAALETQIGNVRDGFDFLRDGAKGFVSDLKSGLKEGQTIFEAFGNAAMNVLDKLLDKLVDVALNSAIGGGGSGIGGFLSGIAGALGVGSGGGSFSIGADGGGAGGIGPLSGFAKGGAFTNSVVSKPTLFSFAKGTALGQMGEAGPEAVMPLRRGPDGSLGVQSHGVGGGGGQAPVQVQVTIAAEPGEMFTPVVRDIAQQESASAMQSGIQQYDKELPSRFASISRDTRAR